MLTPPRLGFALLRFVSGYACAVLLAGAPSARAADANLYLAGPDVRLEQAAPGDVVAAAGRISVDAAVEGDAVLAAGSVDVRAPIGDDLRAAGGIITLTSAVAGESLVAGASVHVASDADLHGRAWLAGNEVTLDGRLRDEVKAYARTLVVGGELEGPATLSGERIEILPSARIHGDLRYSSTHAIVIRPGAQITGKVVREPGVFQMPRPKIKIPGVAAVRPLLLFGLLAAGILMYAVFPRYTVNAVRSLHRAPLKSLGLGTAMFFSGPPIILLLVITIIGIPVALVVAALYGIALLAGYLLAAFFVGDRLLALARKTEGGNAWRIGSLALALALLWLVRHIPYVGGLLILTALLLGLGALALQAFTQYSDRA